MNKLIITTVSIILVFMFLMLVFLPKYRDFRILKAQVLEKETELLRREEYLSQLNFLNKKLEKYNEELKKIDSTLPKDPGLPALFEFLQKICSQNGLVFKKVGNFSTNSKEDIGKIEETKVEFEISGQIESFLIFLENIEKSARLIEISSVLFEQPEKGDVFNFKIEAKVYSQK